MAKTSVENNICQTCGAEIRAGALFCYSCGSSVEPQPATAPETENDVGKTGFRDGSAVKNNNRTAKLDQPVNKQILDEPILKPDATEEIKLKSAAAMRRKSKIYQPRKIEIVWEDNESKANGWFIAAAIALTLIVVGIFYLAIYLR